MLSDSYRSWNAILWMCYECVIEFLENRDVQYGDLSDANLYPIKAEQVHQEAKDSPEHATPERKGQAPVKCTLWLSINY